MAQRSNSQEHYENLLADAYDWMQGGWRARVDSNLAFFSEHSLVGPGYTVDLGAGTGYQSAALAQHGYRVLAVDNSKKMLNTLSTRCADLEVSVAEGEMLGFSKHLEGEPNLIVCMGDSLPHVASEGEAVALLKEAHDALAPGGSLVLQFRDLTRLPEGNARFLPIRSDADRIFTCMLEEVSAEHVRVHDLLHQRSVSGFEQHISSYLKCRFGATWIDETLAQLGFIESHSSASRGLLTRVATRESR